MRCNVLEIDLGLAGDFALLNASQVSGGLQLVSGRQAHGPLFDVSRFLGTHSLLPSNLILCVLLRGHTKTAAAVTSLFLLVPLQAKAQNAELTLNCRNERAFDAKKDLSEPLSGSFSAIVQMQTLKDGTPAAVIQATTIYCSNFEGTFDDLEVSGDCERTLSDSTKVNAKLTLPHHR